MTPSRAVRRPASRRYFHERKHVRIASRAAAVTDQLSTKLQMEVVISTLKTVLNAVPFLRGCENAFVVRVGLA